MKLKEQLLAFCWKSVEDRAARIQKRGKELQESLGSETKSSAGDKHETGRAMVQLEQEKLGKQSIELDKITRVLEQVDISGKGENIRLGSLVKTDKALYFISISAGAFQSEDGLNVFCVSPGSPIGQLVLGKQMGDSIVFNGKQIKILEVK